MDSELMNQVAKAESVEELLVLAKEKDYPLDREQAEDLFTRLHASGELSDEELDSVAGGGCTTKVNGHKYTIVTRELMCFNGCFEPGFRIQRKTVEGPLGNVIRYGLSAPLKNDHVGLRKAWRSSNNDIYSYGGKFLTQCRDCYHLEFNGGIGYCGKS